MEKFSSKIALWKSKNIYGKSKKITREDWISHDKNFHNKQSGQAILLFIFSHENYFVICLNIDCA